MINLILPERILITCQGSDKEPFRHEIPYLFKSLINFGGRLASAQKIAFFDGPVNEKLITELSEMGVKVKHIQTIDGRCIHANKIQMLKGDEFDFDYLVALDADIVIAKDFSSFIGRKSIGMKPADNDPFDDINKWKILFKHFGLEIPPERFFSNFTSNKLIPYFNSGVLIVPKEFISPLYETWKYYTLKILDAYSNLPEISEATFFTDQFALSLALVKLKLPFHALPLEMNFPTHYPIHESFEPQKIEPYLIHYHHKFSSKWEILSCCYDNINKMITKINLAIRYSFNKN